MVCVEGANDTIALDALGIAAVGLNSNRATDQQIDKLERIARQTSKGRITLLPDNDEEGEAGFQELLWSLSDRQLDVRLGWSRIRGNGKYDGLQPECITSETWQEIAANLLIKTR